jgi:hypothetical protein
VPFDRVIEQRYEVIVENIVEVPVEKEIIVPIRTISANPIETENLFEKDIVVDTYVEVPIEGREYEECDVEITDDDLNYRIKNNRVESQRLNGENRNLQNEIRALQSEINHNSSGKFNNLMSHNAALRSDLHELESKLNIVQKDTERLIQALNDRTKQHVNYTVIDPAIGPLKAQLETLLHENSLLVTKVKNTPPVQMPGY